jgi:cephalosporin hydroxylase
MLVIDEERGRVRVTREGVEADYDIGSPEAFREIARVYLRSGWDAKYVYSFTWLGRPVIQLPDDMLRIQEVIYRVKPAAIVEIGVAHGGSLIYSASVCHAMGRGRVIGVDIEIRPHNRKAIEEHELSDYIQLVEGDSVASETVAEVQRLVGDEGPVIVFLDGKHTKEHVASELHQYAPMVSVGSYIVAMDGIMGDLVGAPRSEEDWSWNNPTQAAVEFTRAHPDFELEEPEMPFNEGAIVERTPTYWPQAFIRRVS